MKKVILSLVALAIIFTLCSCNEPACKHDDPTKVVVCEAKSPTCQESGLTQGMKCTLCDTMVVPQMVIPKLECVESDWIVDKEPSKTENGKKHTECTLCHRTIQDVLIHAYFQGLQYSLNMDGKSYSITGLGGCTDQEIVIPSEYNGLPVTTIGYGAFSYCNNLTSIVIPDSVTTIGDAAFYGCSSLTSVVIPDSVTTIGGGVFFDCFSLISVVIPDRVTSIGDSAFFYCTSLTSIVIPGSVTTVAYGAFNNCLSLKDVYYIGSEEKWEEIAINSHGNEHLTNATIHYNYVPEN